MSTQKSKNNAGPSALDAMANGLIAKQMSSGRQMGPVEFVENIVDAFDLTLFLSQRVLFKSIYCEELDDTIKYSACGAVGGACTGSSCTVDHGQLLTEQELMDLWVREDRCNWRHPNVLLTETNVSRLLEGKRPRKNFQFQNITFQAGMRCLTGDTRILVKGRGLVRFDELLPTATDVEIEARAEGLEVWTRNGYKRVTGVLSRPATPTIRILTSSGQSIKGTPEHPLYVRDKAGSVDWKLMVDIQPGDGLLSAAVGPWDTYDERWDTVVIAEPGACEPVYDIEVPDGGEYIANGFVSSNSSKSASVALLCVYEFFKHITSDCPQKDLGVPKASSIYITVIASTEQQVKGTIFWYVKEYINKSSFFKAKIDAGEIIVNDLQISFPSKGVIIACGHSRATSIVGRTAVMVAFDELAMFSADDDHTSNAADVYTRVGKSTATYKHHAKRIALSSVKCEGDFMETLVRDDWDRQAQGCLVFNLTTFDFNPLLDKDDAGIASDYAKDPAAAARDYENMRPGTIGAFFIAEVVDRTCVKDPNAVVISQPQAIFRKRGEAVDIQGQVLTDSEDDVREMSGLQVAVVPQLSLLSESYGFCDIGIKHDSFGFALGHVEWSEFGTRYIVDAVLEWRPRFLGKNKWALVDTVNAEEVILEIARKRNMTRLMYDQWNAASSVQRLFRENIITAQTAFTTPFQKKIYDNLRKKMNAGMVELPNNAVLIEELKNIELRNGESIQHPKNKDSTVLGHGKISKDLADVCAGLVWNLTQAFDNDGALPPPSATPGGNVNSSAYLVGAYQAGQMQSKLQFFTPRR